MADCDTYRLPGRNEHQLALRAFVLTSFAVCILHWSNECNRLVPRTFPSARPDETVCSQSRISDPMSRCCLGFLDPFDCSPPFHRSGLHPDALGFRSHSDWHLSVEILF